MFTCMELKGEEEDDDDMKKVGDGKGKDHSIGDGESKLAHGLRIRKKPFP